MKELLLVSVALVLAPLGLALAEPLLTHVDVYTSGTQGYHTFRIPTVETAPDGTLLAFAEARKHGRADPGFGKQDIDLVLRRSTDHGRTWSPMVVIEDPGEGWSAANAATVVDRQKGRVWVLYIRSKPGRSTHTSRPGTDDMQTIARTSDDNGATWSDPIDLTRVARDFDDPKWRASVVGPGGAIQTRTGRLLVPVWKYPYNVFTIYSDDHGTTWRRGAFAPGLAGNENELVELADGRVLMDARQAGGKHRWRTVSADGGHTWSKPRPGEAVSACACAIERLTRKSAGADRDRILWTGPKGPGRRTLVARLSTDEGTSFPHERLLSAEPAAYSDLTLLRDGSAGVLWERAVYKFITLTRVNVEFLDAPAPPSKP